MIADFHARAIQSLDNAALIAISGSNFQKTHHLAATYQCKAIADYNELLSLEEIDVVTIATPSGAHMEPAIAAALRLKHVLCEKPIEVSIERIDNMIAAHAAAGTYIGGIFNYRYHDAVSLLKNAIDSNRFGTITYAAVRVPWWRNEEYYKDSWHGTRKLDGGGALMNQSIHMVDMLQYLMGPVEFLSGYTNTVAHAIEVEDTATAILKFRNGALGSVYGSTASFPGHYRSLEVTGTAGTVIMVENSLSRWEFADTTDFDQQIRIQYGSIEGGGGVSDPKAISFEPHAKNIAAFLQAIEENKPFAIDGAESRKAVEIIQAIYKSAAEKRTFHFSDSTFR